MSPNYTDIIYFPACFLQAKATVPQPKRAVSKRMVKV
jgi:hypothetical protein